MWHFLDAWLSGTFNESLGNEGLNLQNVVVMEGDAVVEVLHLDKAGPILNLFLCLIDKVNDFSASMSQSRTSSGERKQPIPTAMTFSWDAGDCLFKIAQEDQRADPSLLQAGSMV